MQLRRLMMQKRKEGVIDLSLQDVYGNPINQSTANCYVVSKPGTYKFPCVYGNAIKNGKTNAAAYTNNGGTYSHDFVDGCSGAISSPYIEFGPNENTVSLRNYDTEDVIQDLSLDVDSGYITFTVTDVPPTGANAIVTLWTDGFPIWSWHIWLWLHDLSPVEITNSGGYKYKIMPVNLATKLDTDDSINKTTGWKNWFYQFGRPMPLLCPAAYNSTSNHSTGAINILSAAAGIYEGIQNPTTFYKYESTNYNWFNTNSSKTYNLWDAACAYTGNSDNNVVKTVYDPCPVGWKVPNGNTFTGLSPIRGGDGILMMSRYSGDTTGVAFSMSGCRLNTSGSLYRVGYTGKVWYSSAESSTSAYNLGFSMEGFGTQDYTDRSNGFSVRPVEDTIEFGGLINFTIAGTTYNAEQGMNWFEWVCSEYNTGGLLVASGSIYYGSNPIDSAVAGDFIIGGKAYELGAAVAPR